MTITIPDANWKRIGADVMAFITIISMIPYDKDTMNIINHLVPTSWIPWVIKAGASATIILRLWDWWVKRRQAQQPMTPDDISKLAAILQPAIQMAHAQAMAGPKQDLSSGPQSPFTPPPKPTSP